MDAQLGMNGELKIEELNGMFMMISKAIKLQ